MDELEGSKKRKRVVQDEVSDSSSSSNSSESSDDEVGPRIPDGSGGDAKKPAVEARKDGEDDDSSEKPKKKKLVDEELYLEDLPNCDRYEKSFMHRDVVSRVIFAKRGFLITASVDGHVKFWKKDEIGIEFVKHFRAHLGNIQDMAVNCTGTLLITVSNDKHGKVFDVQNFDMINIIKFGSDSCPEYCEWIHQAGDALSAVAVTFTQSSEIRIYDANGSSSAPLHTLSNIHAKAVVAIKYNAVFDTVISADNGGMLEYWSGPKGEYSHPKNVMFDTKLDTDLYEFAKNKTYPLSLAVSLDGKLIASYGADRKIRLFRFLSGKLYSVIDESLANTIDQQREKRLFPAMEFSRKMSNEKDLEKVESSFRRSNVVFDKSGNFILYSTINGVKLVNVYTHKCVCVLGRGENNLRFLNISLCHGSEELISSNQMSTVRTMEMEASDNPSMQKSLKKSPPVLVCTAYKKNRFYLLTRNKPKESSADSRDVFNEKPSQDDRIAAAAISGEIGAPKLYESATIHTSVGDIFVKLFARECPKTVENFCTHSKNNYFNGCIFHRVIKQFMIQTGDPTGIGTGGESIWGSDFEDEFHPKLRHDRPYTLSMANAGPCTNGSQFFITVLPTPWLDNKHTVFGRVHRGMDVVLNISNVKTRPKTDKPFDDIAILSVTLKDPLSL